MGLKPEEERRFKAKKGGKGHKGKKEHDEDWEAPCEKDDEECWEQFKAEHEEKRFKAKKGGKGHEETKDHDEDWESPCEKDDEECWGEFEDMMKAAFEECADDKSCWE